MNKLTPEEQFQLMVDAFKYNPYFHAFLDVDKIIQRINRDIDAGKIMCPYAKYPGEDREHEFSRKYIELRFKILRIIKKSKPAIRRSSRKRKIRKS